jgi:hypothetical protein
MLSTNDTVQVFLFVPNIWSWAEFSTLQICHHLLAQRLPETTEDVLAMFRSFSNRCQQWNEMTMDLGARKST